MAYSSSAIAAGMNNSAYFKNFTAINTNEENVKKNIGNFDKNGYYKIILSSNAFTIVIETTQGQIISAQSTANTDIWNTYYIHVTPEENIFNLKFRIESPASNENIDLSIESYNGVYSINGEIDPSEENVTSCLFSKTYMFFPTNTSDQTMNSLDVETLTSESINVESIHIGNWKIEVNPEDKSKIKLSYNSEEGV